MPENTGLSVIIITLNEAKKIEQCLESVAFADEIIVVDAGSSDETVQICRRFTQKVYTNTPWPGFGAQKNYALSLATKSWVLSIDADERVPAQLAQEIQQIISQKDALNGYKMPRNSSFCGKFMRFSGWTPDYVTRLFKRSHARFSDDFVHERVIVEGEPTQIGKLNTPLIHYAVENKAQAARKMHQYALLSARNKYKNNKNSSQIEAIFRSFWAFLRTFVFQLGLLDGKQGLTLALFNANGTYRKYTLLQQLNRHNGELTCALVVPTYNWPQALDKVLVSISQQTHIPDEIIIADDGSKDDTRHLIEQFKQTTHLPVKHIWHEDKGFRLAKIRNRAIASSNSRVIIMVDGDCVMPHDFIAQNMLLTRPGHIINGNRVILNQSQSQHLLNSDTYQALSNYNWLNRKQRAKLLNIPLGPFRYFQPKRWQGVRGCNMTFYRDDFIAVNGCDENFEGWGYEDSHMVIRLYNYGVRRIAGRFASTVLHNWHKTNIDQEQAQRNMDKLQKAIKENATSCEKGVNQYLSQN